MSESIKKVLKNIPQKPGIYIFKDLSGSVLYVGKAINLKNRVNSYFQKQDLRPQIVSMIDKIESVDYLVVASELEALITETDFIKRYKPKYNIKMKDDKNYLFIKITSEDFPQVTITRRVIKDGAYYYGPFTDSVRVRKTLKILRDTFPFRSCKNTPLKNKDRACLNFHLGRCKAPCVGAITKEGYQEIVDGVKNFLGGTDAEIINNLYKEMLKESEGLNYERALVLKERLITIKSVLEKQTVVSSKGDIKDIFGYFYKEQIGAIVLLQIRDGKITGKENFLVEFPDGEEKAKIMASFLKQYYKEASFIPQSVVIPDKIYDEDKLEIASLVMDRHKKKVNFFYPQKGRLKKLIQMATSNAREYLKTEETSFLNRYAKNEIALSEIARLMKIGSLKRIECFDISNISGAFAVGSMVVFDSGVFKKSDYRKFNIKSADGPNDFAMIEEVIKRRFINLKGTDKSFSALPDLVIVDGGKGQLSSAKKAVEAVGIKGVSIASLAKKDETLFFYLHDQVKSHNFKLNSSPMFFLQNIRDEAHRFAIQHHRIVRGKSVRKSALDDIFGLGSKTKKLLLEEFGTLGKIKEADEERLIKLIGKSKTKKLRENL
jgi:excinuclease ABC subunit C